MDAVDVKGSCCVCHTYAALHQQCMALVCQPVAEISPSVLHIKLFVPYGVCTEVDVSTQHHLTKIQWHYDATRVLKLSLFMLCLSVRLLLAPWTLNDVL